MGTERNQEEEQEGQEVPGKRSDVKTEPQQKGEDIWVRNRNRKAKTYGYGTETERRRHMGTEPKQKGEEIWGDGTKTGRRRDMGGRYQNRKAKRYGDGAGRPESIGEELGATGRPDASRQ